MSEYRNPDESSWWPRDLPEEAQEKLFYEMLEEEQGPQRVSIQMIEELLKHSEKRYREIVETLDLLGIKIWPPVWDCRPDMFDMSACDERSTELASLMFELGCIAANHARWDNGLRRLRRVAINGEAGGAKSRAGGEETRTRTHTAFAKLLENNLDARDRGLEPLSEQLAPSLKKHGRGYSAGNIRTKLMALHAKVKKLARGPKVPASPMDARIRAIVALAGDDPGITFHTVRYFLYKLPNLSRPAAGIRPPVKRRPRRSRRR